MVVVLLVAGCAGPGVEFSGADEESTSVSGMRLRVGQEAAFGASVLVNRGDETVTLVSARAEGAEIPPSAAEVTRTLVYDYLKYENGMLGAGLWPEEEYGSLAVPLEGYELAPGEEVSIMLVVKLNRRGRWTWPTTTVVFATPDGKRHRTSVDHGVQVQHLGAPD